MAETQASTRGRKAKPRPDDAAVEQKVATVVVKFPSFADAERALHALNKSLRGADRAILQGAVVSRRENGELRVRDMRDAGLGSLIVDAADTTVSIGLGGLGLLAGIAAAGVNVLLDSFRLAWNSAGRVAGLASDTLAYQGRKLLAPYEPGPEIAQASAGLAPGEIAIIVTADAKTARELTADLKKSGGLVA